MVQACRSFLQTWLGLTPLYVVHGTCSALPHLLQGSGCNFRSPFSRSWKFLLSKLDVLPLHVQAPRLCSHSKTLLTCLPCYHVQVYVCLSAKKAGGNRKLVWACSILCGVLADPVHATGSRASAASAAGAFVVCLHASAGLCCAMLCC